MTAYDYFGRPPGGPMGIGPGGPAGPRVNPSNGPGGREIRRSVMRKWTAVILAVSIGVLLVGPGCPAKDEAGMAGHQQMKYTYTVQPNQKTMSDVADAVYGDKNMTAPIIQANPTADPKALKAGTALVIPAQVGPDGKVVSPRGCTRVNVY